MTNELVETLRDAQRFGFFGARPIEGAIEHSRAFVSALGELGAGETVVDLGSGGGLPGLVLAVEYPQTRITLIDRREKRTDFLRRAVSRLGLDHVDVQTGDVADLVREVESGSRPHFSIATARGFGPPARTLTFGSQLVGRSGRIVISEPPDGDRWDPAQLDELGLTGERLGPVRLFSPTGR